MTWGVIASNTPGLARSESAYRRPAQYLLDAFVVVTRTTATGAWSRVPGSRNFDGWLVREPRINERQIGLSARRLPSIAAIGNKSLHATLARGAKAIHRDAAAQRLKREPEAREEIARWLERENAKVDAALEEQRHAKQIGKRSSGSVSVPPGASSGSGSGSRRNVALRERARGAPGASRTPDHPASCRLALVKPCYAILDGASRRWIYYLLVTSLVAAQQSPTMVSQGLSALSVSGPSRPRISPPGYRVLCTFA